MRPTLPLTALLTLLALTVSAPAQSLRARPDPARSMLDRPVANLRLDKVSLADALDFLRDATNANLHVNWRALESVGVTRDALVSVNLRNVPLRKALSYVLQGQNAPISWFVDDGVIEITTREIADKHVYTRVYTIEDLIMQVPDFIGPQFSIQSATQGGQGGGGQSLFQGNTSNQQQQQQPGNTIRDQRGRELADLVTQTVRPEVWRANGGNATIAYFNGMLIVTAPRDVHEAIAGR